MLKKTYLINLSNINDLQNFVNNLNNMVIADVDAMIGRYVVDAKSVLGMMSICNRNIRVGIHSCSSYDFQCFKNICKKYEVTE